MPWVQLMGLLWKLDARLRRCSCSKLKQHHGMRCFASQPYICHTGNSCVVPARRVSCIRSDTKVRLPRNQLARESQKHLPKNDRFIADMSCTSQCQAKQHEDDSRCGNARGQDPVPRAKDWLSACFRSRSRFRLASWRAELMSVPADQQKDPLRL